MSYAIINQRLIGIQLFEHPTDVLRLVPYFYKESTEPIDEPIKEPIDEPKKELIKEAIDEPKKEATNEPKKDVIKKPMKLNLPQDTLFWNIYISVYGLSEYKLIGSKFANVEWTEKNNIRLAFMTTPKALQATNHKVTLGNIQEMMSEYMTGGKTTLLGLIGMAVYYKIPIYLFDFVKKTHLKFIPESVERSPCILTRSFQKYELYNGTDDLEQLCKNSFCLENYQRPLRALSSYKRAELNAIGEMYGFTISVSKDQLYKELSEYLVWIL
jgi:hypothetical protein